MVPWPVRERTARDRVAFIATNDSTPWGGSEELWSQAALDLVSRGFAVAANVFEWSPVHLQVRKLQEAGVAVRMRPRRYSVLRRVQQALMAGRTPRQIADLGRWIASQRPALVVISNGAALPPVELAEFCVTREFPFVTIAQSNDHWWWPVDDQARRYRRALPAARRCYFVSKANLSLAEKQIGARFENAEVVRNPFHIDYNATLPWSHLGGDSEVRFACVGRLHPASKGQDILLEALAGKSWLNRHWRLHLYGEGPMRDSLERLAQSLGIADRVVFGGFRPVDEIWASNHVLVMPSRYEGLPLAMVEAMLCARPVIATDVAGHSEIIENGVTGFLADAPTVSSIADALERFWARRSEAEAIGRAGALRIRQLVPPDPAQVFADKLLALVDIARPVMSAPSSSYLKEGEAQELISSTEKLRA